MAIEGNGGVLREIGAVFRDGIAAETTDLQLLERFATRDDESAERSFALLVERHGPMVMRVCRSVLRDDHDARDSFQAVFLVLVRRAGSLRIAGSLGPWLHGVALRVATSSRDTAARRRALERRAIAAAGRPGLQIERADDDLGPAIQEEVGRLPDGYRKAVILCDLQGLTHEEAARRLGWPVGTVKSRQARGRERLRGRLIRRGLAPAAAGAAMFPTTGRASAALPMRLVDSTARFATLVANRQPAAELLSAAALLLSKGVLRAMLLNRLKIAAGAVFLAGSFSAATAWSLQAVGQAEPPEPGPRAAAKAWAPRSPLDTLRSADIAAENKIDMQGDVVAVLGERRGRHAGAVYCVALAPDGKTLVTCADQDRKIRLWDAGTFAPIAALAGHRSSVNCIAISPDGHRLASGSAYGDFLIWDLTVAPPKGPTRLIPRSGEANNLLHATAFSADSKTLAIAGDGKGVGLYDVSGAQPVPLGRLPDFDPQVHSLTFSPVGKRLALAGLEDGSVRLWNIAENPPREMARLDSPPPAAPGRSHDGVISVGFAPDGNALAALQGDGGVRIWDLSAEPPADKGRFDIKPKEENIGMSSVLWGHAMVAVAPGGKSIAAARRDGSIRVWDLSGDAPPEGTIPAAHPGGTGPLAFTPDGKTLISGGGDHLIRSWDVARNPPLESRKPIGVIGGLERVMNSKRSAEPLW